MYRMLLVPLGTLFALSLLAGCSDNSASATSRDSVTSSSPTVVDNSRSRIPRIKLTGPALKETAGYVSVTQVETADTVDWELWNPYTEATQRFGGVLLRDFVAQHAPDATRVLLTAVDDYQVSLTANEWNNHEVLLATRTDGKNMTVADKGPARIVVRHKSGDTAAIEKLKPKWIWQITEIVFE